MIIYLIKSTLLLGLLFGVYKLLLENEKIHRFNRFFLLFALAFGLRAPLISFGIHPEQSIAGIKMQQMERVINAPAEAVRKSVGSVITVKPDASREIAPVTSSESGWPISTTDMVLGLYGLITLFFFIRFAGGLFNILGKIKSGIHEKAGPATLVLLDEPTTPQSFFWFIFLNKDQFESGEIEPEILDHEMMHVCRLHSLDVLVIEFLKVIFWFNPFMYLYKHAIQLNHEYIADESVAGKVTSASDYQKMLIRVCAGNKPMRTTSSIDYSLTKKRLRMMFRTHSPLRSWSKTVLLLPLLASLTLAFCSKKMVYTISDLVPSKTYNVPELHFDGKRSEELGKPLATYYTSSGESFTGTQNVYYTQNDSLYMKLYFKDGINTGSLMHRDGNVIRQKHGRYLNGPYTKEIYVNGVLVYQNIPPTESEDGIGHLRGWYKNGQLSVKVSYTGNQMYQGIMTSYDKDGNIIKQERYKDGKLVKRIK